MIEEDICGYCHHIEEEHHFNAIQQYCSGYVSDGQGEVGCYCSKYRKQTQQDIDEEIAHHNKSFQKSIEYYKLSNQISRFFKGLINAILLR